jgi:hypothetical protein
MSDLVGVGGIRLRYTCSGVWSAFAPKGRFWRRHTGPFLYRFQLPSEGQELALLSLYPSPFCGAGQTRTITAVVNALAKAGVDLGENDSVIPRPKGKLRDETSGTTFSHRGCGW